MVHLHTKNPFFVFSYRFGTENIGILNGQFGIFDRLQYFKAVWYMYLVGKFSHFGLFFS
jgi:hypothetical protein